MSGYPSGPKVCPHDNCPPGFCFNAVAEAPKGDELLQHHPACWKRNVEDATEGGVRVIFCHDCLHSNVFRVAPAPPVEANVTVIGTGRDGNPGVFPDGCVASCPHPESQAREPALMPGKSGNYWFHSTRSGGYICKRSALRALLAKASA